MGPCWHSPGADTAQGPGTRTGTVETMGPYVTTPPRELRMRSTTSPRRHLAPGNSVEHPPAAICAGQRRPDPSGSTRRCAAECHLVRSTSTSTDCQTFAVRELLVLEDGHRVPLREGLEFTIGVPCADVHDALTRESLIDAMRAVVLPELSAIDPERPWDCLVRLARRRRVQTCAEEISQLPYELILTESVLAWL